MKTLLLSLALALSAFAADQPGGEIAPVLASWKQALLKGDAAALRQALSQGSDLRSLRGQDGDQGRGHRRLL